MKASTSCTHQPVGASFWPFTCAAAIGANRRTPASAQNDGQQRYRWASRAESTSSTSYYFRGIVQETSGFIAQPYLEAGLHQLYEGDNGSVSLAAGTWNSLHSTDRPERVRRRGRTRDLLRE